MTTGASESWEGALRHDRASEGSLPAVLKSQCSKCGETKLASDFATDRSKAGGHKSWCKRCDNEKSRRYYAANSKRIIKRVLAKRRDEIDHR